MATINGGQDADTLTGTSGDDLITGATGADSISGGEGNDTLSGDGGAGFEVEIVNASFAAGTTGWAVTGTGTIVYNGSLAFNGANRPAGGTASQSITTIAGHDYALSFEAFEWGTSSQNHTLVMDVLDASGVVIATITQVIFDETTQTITVPFTAQSAATTLRFSNPTSTGSNGSDLKIDSIRVLDLTAQAAAGADTIDGGAGDDLIYGNDGGDVLYGGDGNDTIFGDAGTLISQTIINPDFAQDGLGWTTSGNVSFYPSQAAAFNGSDGPAGGRLSQTITTTAGRTYQLSLEASEFGGGVGSHTLLVEVLDATGAVIATGSYVISDGTTQTITVPFVATGTTATLRFTNTATSNTFSSDLWITDVSVTSVAPVGEGGDDSIFGGAGDDLIYGNEGSDQLWGGDGNDTIYGDADGPAAHRITVLNGDFSAGTANWTTNTGGTTIVYNGALAFNANEGAPGGGFASQNVAILAATDYRLTLDAFEFGGGNFDHTLLVEVIDAAGLVIATQSQVILNDAAPVAITLDFRANTDVVTIRLSNPTSTGTAVSDLKVDNVSIVALPDTSRPAGNNTIDGGAGDDLIFGGAGDDLLIGGLGNDTFVPGSGHDTIADFGTATGSFKDGDPSNNDFVDLSEFYSQERYDAAVANGLIDPTVIDNPLAWLRADFADDGILNDAAAGWGDGNSLTLRNNGAPIDERLLTFESTGVICFTTGTMITTDFGEIAVEDLSQGARVLTMDAGYQTIRWIGSRHFDETALISQPNLRPIRIMAGALGLNAPQRDLIVSPQHRILIKSAVAQRMFGVDEVLIPAKLLLACPGVFVDESVSSVTYWHFLFDCHQVVFANGLPAESLFTGPEAMKSVSPEARHEILSIFPHLAEMTATSLPRAARDLVKGPRARKLMERIVKNQQSASFAIAC